MRTTHAMTVAALGLAVVTAATGDALAARRVASSGVVTARSLYGHGNVTGHTRAGPYGPEVQLPSGTWTDCAGDCREALRVKSIDFWDEQMSNHSPGGEHH